VDEGGFCPARLFIEINLPLDKGGDRRWINNFGVRRA